MRQEGIPVRLYLGCEFLYSDAKSFAEHFEDITLLNHTAHQLMEFYFDVEAQDVLDAIDAVKAAGRIPVIAHPERYECVQSEDGWPKPIRISIKGALLQMNKGSLFRRYGEYAQDTVMELLARHYITFVGSDAHHIRYRTPLMGDAYDLVSEQFGRAMPKRSSAPMRNSFWASASEGGNRMRKRVQYVIVLLIICCRYAAVLIFTQERQSSGNAPTNQRAAGSAGSQREG